MASICLFGSQARRTADRWSDHDVLVISDDVDNAADFARSFVSDKSNVMAISKSQLIDMSQCGSIFLQHLKQEAIIIVDKDKFLERNLNEFMPHGRYEVKATIAAAQLLNVTHVQGHNYWQNMCLADILYVLMRNMLILRNASNGRYIFDYSSLIIDCSRRLGIDGNQMSALMRLRVMKHHYRVRHIELHNVGILRGSMQTCQAIAESILGEFGSIHHSEADIEDEYFSMRRTELALMEVCDPRVLDSIEPDQPGFFEWQAIRNPSGYPRPRRIGKIEISAFRDLCTHREHTERITEARKARSTR